MPYPDNFNPQACDAAFASNAEQGQVNAVCTVLRATVDVLDKLNTDGSHDAESAKYAAQDALEIILRDLDQ